MNKFKINDKVRVVADEKRLSKICDGTTLTGKTGIVKQYCDIEGVNLPWLIDLGSMSLWLAEQDLELVEPIHHIRTFDSGATRDTTQGKLDYEGFLNPLVLKRYAEYLNKHRIQSDGKLRDSDNWQKGIPISQYMKSKWRHFMDTWLWCRSGLCSPRPDIQEALCAEMFNTMGMLFEILRTDKKLDRELKHEMNRTKSVPGATQCEQP